jgi:hypothetical protein
VTIDGVPVDLRLPTAFTPATLLVVGDGVVGRLAVRAARRWLSRQ